MQTSRGSQLISNDRPNDSGSFQLVASRSLIDWEDERVWGVIVRRSTVAYRRILRVRLAVRIANHDKRHKVIKVNANAALSSSESTITIGLTCLSGERVDRRIGSPDNPEACEERNRRIRSSGDGLADQFELLSGIKDSRNTGRSRRRS